MAISKAKEVKMVQVGKNLTVTIEGNKMVITGEKEQIATAKEAVKTYQAKPTKENEKKMLDLLKPRTAEVTEMKSRIRTEKKAVSKQAQEVAKNPEKIKEKIKAKEVVSSIEDKEFTESELEQMEKAIQKAKEKKKQAPVAKAAPTERRYRGEY